MKTLKLININQKYKEIKDLIGSTPGQWITQTLIKGFNVKTSGFNFLNLKIPFEN
jgi:hypothetical protein